MKLGSVLYLFIVVINIWLAEAGIFNLNKACTCSSTGDPQYALFDGQQFNFSGVCKYLLTQNVDQLNVCAYKVSIKGERRFGNQARTYIRSVNVELNLKGVQFSYWLLGNRRLFVKGQEKPLPYQDQAVSVVLTSSNDESKQQLTLYAEKCKLIVGFTNDSKAIVQIDQITDGSRNTGICGNCDGKKNDLITKLKKELKDTFPNFGQIIGSSWELPDDSDLQTEECIEDKRWTLPTPPPGNDCRIIADIVIVLDSSSSVGAYNWDIMLRFVQDFVRKFTVSPELTRFTLFTYSNLMVNVFDFSTYENVNDVAAKVQKAQFIGGTTYTGKAFNYVATKILTKARQNVKKFVLLLTDGKSNDKVFKVITEAQNLKDSGVNIQVVGIGNSVDKNELNSISSTGSFFSAKSFSALTDLPQSIISIICGGSTVAATEAPTATKHTPFTVSVPPCKNSLVDLILVLDSSGSIGIDNWENMLDIMTKLVNTVKISETDAHVAVVTFGNEVSKVLNLRSFFTAAEVTNAILNARYLTGQTYIGKALYVVYNDIIPYARDIASKVVILVTDGMDNAPPKYDEFAQAKAIKSSNKARLMTVGIGKTNRTELERLSSDDTVYQIRSFEEIEKLALPLRNFICGDPISRGGTTRAATPVTNPVTQPITKPATPPITPPTKLATQLITDNFETPEEVTTSAFIKTTAPPEDTTEPATPPITPPTKLATQLITDNFETPEEVTTPIPTEEATTVSTLPPKPTTPCSCYAIGDPHIKTFDGQMIHYFGICKYTLAKYSGNDKNCNFEVRIQNEVRGSKAPGPTYVQYVEVLMFGKVFKLDKGKLLYVDGKARTVPYSAQDPSQFTTFYSGDTVQFFSQACDVAVNFNGDANSYVQVGGRYAYELTGICGDCNSEQDDYKTQAGVDVSNKGNKYTLVGDSYQVDRDTCTPQSLDPPSEPCTNKNQMETVMATTACNFAGQKLIGDCFKSGVVDFDSWTDSCKLDLCLNKFTNKAAQDAVRCSIIQAVMEDCRRAGYEIDWRKTYRCPMICSKTATYSMSMDPCEPSCDDLRNELPARDCSKLPKVEGCQCDSSSYRLGANGCIKKADCIKDE